MELGLEEDSSNALGLSSEGSESISSWELFLPDEQRIQEIVGQVQQMLTEDSSSAPQAKALSSDLDVDWSATEVIIDEAAGEALIVLPQSGNAAPQRLWGIRKRPVFDDGSALFVKFPIRRESASARPVLWKVEPVAPKMRWGQEYERPFEFCPYRWYGRLAAFSRPLCEGSWKRWHRKQWDKKGIEVLASLYNATAKAQGPSTLYFPYKEGKALLIHGKEQILKDLIQRLSSLSENLSAEGILQSPKNQGLLAILMAEAQAMPSWEDLKKAIEFLALHIRDPILYEKALEDLIKNDPAFAQFWDLLVNGALVEIPFWVPIVGGSMIQLLGLGEQKAREIVDNLAWLASKPEFWKGFTQTIDAAIKGMEALGITQETVPRPVLAGMLWVFRTLAARNALDAISFGLLFHDTINLILSCSDCSDAEKRNLIHALLGKAAFTWWPIGIWYHFKRAVIGGIISVDEFVFDVRMINAFLRHGWRPIAIDFNVGSGVAGFGDRYVDLVARIYSSELGRTITAYINSYDKFDPKRVTEDMKRI